MKSWAKIAVLVFMACAMAACAKKAPPVSGESVANLGWPHWQNQRESAGLADEPVVLTLDKALAIAVERNLQFRVSTLEAAVASGNHKISSLSLLPALTTQAGYQARSNLQGSFSESISTGTVSLEPSVSSERQSSFASFQMSWNVLDFGLAWSRRNQQADQFRIAEENRRKVSHAIARDVIYAWDQAMAYQSIREELEETETQVREALMQSEQILLRRLQNPLDVIEYRKSILLMLKKLQQLSHDMHRAYQELLRMLDFPFGANIVFEDDESGQLLRLDQEYRADVWQVAAMINRPEVRSAWYEHRVAQRGGNQVFMESLPALAFRYGGQYDSNKYLFNNFWNDASAQISWDLMRLASYPARRRQAKLQQDLSRRRFELQANAVMAQVLVAKDALSHSLAGFCISNKIANVDQQRVNIIQVQSDQRVIDSLTVARVKLDNILLRLEAEFERANKRQAIALLVGSVGIGLIPDIVEGEDLEQEIKRWRNDELDSVISVLLRQSSEILASNNEQVSDGLPFILDECE